MRKTESTLDARQSQTINFKISVSNWLSQDA